MTVTPLYSLQPKKTRFEHGFVHTPMYNNRGLCGFRPHFGYLLPYGGVNICKFGGGSDAVIVRMQGRNSGRGMCDD